MIHKQTDFVHNREWDILFVLDACRIDKLKDLYKDYLPGYFCEVQSPATFTLGWLIDTFYNKPKTNAVFVSSDYEVNSSGFNLDTEIHDKKKREKYGHIKFDYREYFNEIVDVWKHIDEKLGLVHPKTICDEVINQVKKGNRVIAKFWQVHDPYIYHLRNENNKVINYEDTERRNSVVYKGSNLKRYLSYFFADITIWRIKKLLGRKEESGLYSIWCKYGHKGIVKGYEEDLKLVLSEIKRVHEKFPDKKMVITTDHSEYLGERGMYGHSVNSPELLGVPWLEITNE